MGNGSVTRLVSHLAGSHISGRTEFTEDWMRHRISLALSALTVIFLSETFSIATAQPSQPVLQLVEPLNFHENFSMSGMRAAPPASVDPARVLVGLHLGKGGGTFQIGQIGIILSPKVAAEKFCVRVSSGDMRYVSVNLYRRATDKHAAPLVETKSKKVAELAKLYKSSQIAIRIVESAKCNTEIYGGDADGPLAPAIPPGVTDANVLVAFVNVGASPASVSLFERNKMVADGECQPADETLFTGVCDLPLTNLGKAHPDKLQVIFVDQSGQRVEVPYRIDWSEPKP